MRYAQNDEGAGDRANKDGFRGIVRSAPDRRGRRSLQYTRDFARARLCKRASLREGSVTEGDDRSLRKLSFVRRWDIGLGTKVLHLVVMVCFRVLPQSRIRSPAPSRSEPITPTILRETRVDSVGLYARRLRDVEGAVPYETCEQ